MTPRERVLATLRGESADRIPNFNILMAYAARHIGRGMDEFCRDHRVLVEANLAANEVFGIDLLNTMSDAYRETADYGARIAFPKDALPVCQPLIAGPADMRLLKPFKIEDSSRMLDRLRAVELYKRKAGDEWPIMGWVEGCVAESADLMGLTGFALALYDEPEMVRDMMEICLETAVGCAQAQVRAGADIIGVGDAVASVLGPKVYDEWALPYEQRLFAEIHRCGAKGRLHICGDIGPLLDGIRVCGADIVDVDWMVDFKTAHDALRGAAIVCGNFDPVSVVLAGTPETVAAAVDECRDAVDDDCIIMAGCEIPRDTPAQNLAAVSQALERRGRPSAKP
ncbi:MAG: uroporphyrinogen decarboxylase family protein [Bifidobacteriaceae bacterium]|jgi:uroporphyrinogen decarboxylase|nr:uroporphyrinogen decarboxylase family protein [Bifidobacteriaceae bacterium]